MALSKKAKIEIITLVIIIVVILAVVYISFISPYLKRGTFLGGVSVSEEDPIVAQLANIKTGVLDDEEFTNLNQGSSLPVTPGERGIANPFLGQQGG